LNAGCLEAVLDALPGGQVRILDARGANGLSLRAIGETFSSLLLDEAKMPAQAAAEFPDAPDGSGGDHCSGNEINEIVATLRRTGQDECRVPKQSC
jgi:hypothetical protein